MLKALVGVGRLTLGWCLGLGLVEFTLGFGLRNLPVPRYGRVRGRVRVGLRGVPEPRYGRRNTTTVRVGAACSNSLSVQEAAGYPHYNLDHGPRAEL